MKRLFAIKTILYMSYIYCYFRRVHVVLRPKRENPIKPLTTKLPLLFLVILQL